MTSDAPAPPLLLVLLLVALGDGAVGALREAFGWRQLEWAWPSEGARQAALASGAFRPDASLPLGLEVAGGRVFVTVPRWRGGVPASLAAFALNATSRSPALAPFPDWAAHDASAEGWGALPSRLVSPFRVRADACGRLWVLDGGRAPLLHDDPPGGRQLAPAALLVFDLRSDRLLRRFEWPRAQLSDASLLVSVAVDAAGDACAEAHAYAADAGAAALLVYSWASDASWRLRHNFFLPHPLQGDFAAAGQRFQWADGLFGLALSKANRFGHRTLYFHALSSTAEFQVSTEILQNASRAASGFREFHLVGDRGGSSQAGASVMDEESAVVFFTQVNRDAVACWNSRTRPHLQPSTFGLVAQDNRSLVFPNDVKVDERRNLWVLSDRLPRFLYAALDPNDVNFRILTSTVEEAVNNTICDAAYSGPEPRLPDDLPPPGVDPGGCWRSAAAAPAAPAPLALMPLLLLLRVAAAAAAAAAACE